MSRHSWLSFTARAVTMTIYIFFDESTYGPKEERHEQVEKVFWYTSSLRRGFAWCKFFFFWLTSSEVMGNQEAGEPHLCWPNYIPLGCLKCRFVELCLLPLFHTTTRQAGGFSSSSLKWREKNRNMKSIHTNACYVINNKFLMTHRK